MVGETLLLALPPPTPPRAEAEGEVLWLSEAGAVAEAKVGESVGGALVGVKGGLGES